MKQIFYYLLDRLRFFIHCKLGLFKIPKHKRIFNQEELISKIKGSGMEAVVDSVGKTNNRVKFKDLLDYSTSVPLK